MVTFGSSDGVRLRDEVVLSLSITYLLYLLCHLRPRYKLYNYLRYAQQCDQKLNSEASAPAAELVCAYQRYVHVSCTTRR
jgi:hypothetical protein